MRSGSPGCRAGARGAVGVGDLAQVVGGQPAERKLAAETLGHDGNRPYERAVPGISVPYTDLRPRPCTLMGLLSVRLPRLVPVLPDAGSA